MIGFIEIISTLGGSVAAAAVITEAVLARIDRRDRIDDPVSPRA